MTLPYTGYSLLHYITGPVALATFWLPLTVTALLGLMEWRRKQLKLPPLFVLVSVLLLPATYYLSYWKDYGSFSGWHILPLPLLVVASFVWLRGHVSTSAVLAILYTHVLTIDIYAAYRLLENEPEHPRGWLRGIGAANWGDYLLLLPLFAVISFGIIQYAIMPWLFRKYPQDAARCFPGRKSN